MAKIATKPEMYDLLRRGRLGNHWPLITPCEAAQLHPMTHVGIRWTHGAGGPCVPLIYAMDLEAQLSRLEAEGWPRDGFCIGQIVNVEHHITLQGEVMRSIRHYEMTYSHVQKPMRQAFREQTLSAHGMMALALLQTYCDPGTLDDFQELWDEYPDAIIEFTAYQITHGSTKKRNTVIWEMRDY